MESLINKYTNTYISFTAYLKSRAWIEAKGQLLKGDLAEKRIRNAAYIKSFITLRYLYTAV